MHAGWNAHVGSMSVNEDRFTKLLTQINLKLIFRVRFEVGVHIQIQYLNIWTRNLKVSQAIMHIYLQVLQQV